MIVNTDIDIDIANRDKLLSLIENTPAMIKREHTEKKHNTGVYFHEMPTNPYNGLATIDHKDAEKMGYFKMDLLNVSVYNDMWLKDYTTQLIKQQWGANLIKFEGMQLPGGVTLNGRQIYDDATAALEALMEKLKLEHELPPDFYIG